MYIYYNRDQLILPMDLEILIPEHHLCRIVDLAVEKMDPALLVSLYPGGGRPAYHPKMMLKVILYAYANRIYSSRQIAKQLKENIYFICLANWAMQEMLFFKGLRNGNKTPQSSHP